MAKQHKYERLKDFRLGSVFHQLFGHAAGTASGEAHKRIRSTFDGWLQCRERVTVSGYDGTGMQTVFTTNRGREKGIME